MVLGWKIYQIYLFHSVLNKKRIFSQKFAYQLLLFSPGFPAMVRILEIVPVEWTLKNHDILKFKTFWSSRDRRYYQWGVKLDKEINEEQSFWLAFPINVFQLIDSATQLRLILEFKYIIKKKVNNTITYPWSYRIMSKGEKTIWLRILTSQLTFTCSKSTKETLEKGVK